MELIIGRVSIVSLLVLLDVAALRWGVNSRGAGGDFYQPGEVDFYYEPETRTFQRSAF